MTETAPTISEIRLKSASRIFAVIPIVIGVFVLVGWAFDNAILKSVLPGLVAMKANTAVVFILIGLALFLLNKKNGEKSSASRILLYTTLILSLLTLLEYLLHANFGIDQLLFTEPSGTIGTVYPGRMAPITTIIFSLLAIAILIGESGKNVGKSQLLILGALLLSTMSAIGYAYGSQPLYEIVGLTQIALHTAVAFIFASLSALFLYPNRGLIKNITNNSSGGVMARRSLTAFVIFLPLIGWLRLLGQRAGYYDLEFGLSLMVIISIGVLSFIIFYNARLIDAVNAESLEVEKRTEEYYHFLEKTAEKRTAELWIKLKELEDSRKASLNVLEDLEFSKASLEHEKATDEALLESIGDGVIATNPTKEGRITLMNKAAELMLGLNTKESLGKPFTDIVTIMDERGNIVPKEKRPVSIALLGEVITTSLSDNQYYYVRKDGTRFPVAITLTPVKLGGKIVGTVEVFRDITKEKKIDQAKTEFISLASHQLRTPLATMKWYGDMLIAGDVGVMHKKQLQYAKEIYSGNQRMIDLVNALLNVSRIEMGTFTVEAVPSDVKKITNNVLSDFASQLSRKKVEIESDYDATLPLVSLDEKLLRVILQNLISNSIKYSPEKTRIQVSVHKKDGAVLFRVSDAGCGIPPKDQDKIFSKLFRADNAKIIDPDGTGLGLYIVKAIIDAVGGKIWFESPARMTDSRSGGPARQSPHGKQEEQGTTFFFSIPLSGMKSRQGEQQLVELPSQTH
ncbi:MAG: ATP-binding protein [Candidatus Taylorbacteria bacterium]